LFIAIIGILFATVPLQADTSDVKVDQQILDKQKNIEALQSQIKQYTQEIEASQQEQTTLNSTIGLLENRIAKTQLEQAETGARIDLLNIEILRTEQRIRESQNKLERQKELMTHVIQEIQRKDQTLALQLFYGSDRFSQILDVAQQFQQINSDLQKAIEDVKDIRASLVEAQSVQEKQRVQQELYAQSLKKQERELEETKEAKEIIFVEAKQSEKKFQSLVRELKQEQIFVQNQIKQLQASLQKKLLPSEGIGGGLSWPVNPNIRGLSATFHDPTYPFRHLFEHSGIDLPAASGTVVQSAASGYVAWTRRGTQYGNYVMVIHSDGIATLYAHLLRIDVVADQFIPRGGQIGLVGSTGFSTGPHLHFEVRKEGIPVNPLTYLDSSSL